MAQNVRSPSLVAGTGSGDVVLFLDEAEQVQAESGSGDVEVRLPLDGEPYDVRADTGSGDRGVQVSTDPDSPRTLRLRTGSGDIRVAYGVPLSGSDPPR